tara:strand:+ start:506 stop:697 length:192 start_codon:yes stop_codon:yes gene_type:complete
MIKIVYNVIRNSFKPDVKIRLGRWGAITDNMALDLRIDRSNEDHCGPCGQYAIEKQKELQKKK